jgi:hypothetical protein
MRTLLKTALAGAFVASLGLAAAAASKPHNARDVNVFGYNGNGGDCVATRWTEWPTTKPIWTCPGDEAFGKAGR